MSLFRKRMYDLTIEEDNGNFRSVVVRRSRFWEKYEEAFATDWGTKEAALASSLDLVQDVLENGGQITIPTAS